MVAPAEPSDVRVGTFHEPPCPLTPELRSDLAYRRAQGETWHSLGVVFRYHSDALRRAAENDPEFAAAQERAWEEAIWEGQADGMRRLRFLANASDDDKALRAAEILVKYAAEQRRNDTRLAVERLRSETRLEAERSKTARRASEPEPEVRYLPPQPAPETDEERQERFAREHAERAAAPKAEVYLWGGKHPLGRSDGPDESDRRVRVKADWSCGLGSRGVVYWVVSDPQPPEARMPGEPEIVPAS